MHKTGDIRQELAYWEERLEEAEKPEDREIFEMYVDAFRKLLEQEGESA